MTDKEPQSRPVIIIEPPWWRCENGNEFRSGHNKPKRCPVCGSANIEMVVDIAPRFSKETNEVAHDS